MCKVFVPKEAMEINSWTHLPGQNVGVLLFMPPPEPISKFQPLQPSPLR